MPTSYTSLLRLAQPADGELTGTWGQVINANITAMVEQAVAGMATVAMADANQTLTTANGTTDQARCAVVLCTGALTASRNVICPTATKVYVVKNATTGGYSIVFKTLAGTGVTVAAGDSALVFCDGTDVVTATSAAGATLGANTFTGNQILSDNQLLRAMLTDCGHTVYDTGNSGTGTVTYNYTNGSVQTCTANGNHTIAFSNWPPTGNNGELLVQLTNGGAYSITFPTINWIKPDGTTTTSVATYLAANTGRTALQSSGMDQFLFWTRDAGTTVYGKLV